MPEYILKFFPLLLEKLRKNRRNPSTVFMNMSTMNLHAALAMAGAIVIAAYILFGDMLQSSDTPKRKKRKRGIVPGLMNIGNSCFLNCILQALASCSVFKRWLEFQASNCNETSLVSSLRKKMTVLSSEVEDCDVDAYDILYSLKNHGWVISREEQDAHELFHALTSTIDDELALIRLRSNSLLDVSWLLQKDADHSHFLNNERGSISVLEGCHSGAVKELDHNEKVIKRGNFGDRLFSSSIITRVSSSLNQQLFPGKGTTLFPDSPFKGHLASQLQCTDCGRKNPEQLSSFESLSLSLPDTSNLSVDMHSLQDLLDAFIRPEYVTGVCCDACTKIRGSQCHTTFTKQLTIGKLPECLCMHIQRTVWLGNGYAVKRKDHITIPEVINMDPYTYTVSLNYQTLQGELRGGGSGGDSERKIFLDQNGGRLKRLEAFSSFCPNNVSQSFISHEGKQWNVYKLQAVVVHVGDVLTGHFVTYRRGPKETSSMDRWFYTSDLVVKEVSLEEVLQSNAYMILYERNLL